MFARAVGWLHDAAERSRVNESVLIASSASLEERAALRLLSDGQGECSDDAFVERARVIARSPGALGRIARAVKHADLLDNVSQRPPRSGAWSPPYGAALVALMMVSASSSDTDYESAMSATGSVGSGCAVAARFGGAVMDEQARSLLEVAGGVLGELDLDVVVDRVLQSARDADRRAVRGAWRAGRLEDGA